MSAAPRVALLHDWLTGHRGGEAVLLALARMFPAAPLYTLVRDAAAALHPTLRRRPCHTSVIQALPGAPRRFRGYLPLFPLALAHLDLSAYDVVLSTSHCAVHGLPRRRGQIHLCYVHSPMRYLYDQMPHYLPGGAAGAALRPLAALAAAPLRAWDRRVALRPTALLANSHFVAARIARAWGRQAAVVHPPVDVAYFAAAPARPRAGYLVVTALVAYKQVGLAIDLANRRRLPLTIIGDGPERARLQRRAGPTVRFAGRITRAALRRAYAGAAGLWFCGAEDFGIAPVEAMAAGCPVLALRAGGLCETVVAGGPDATGVLFDAPDVAAMAAGLTRLTALRAAGGLRPEALRRHAERFSADSFARHFVAHLAGLAPRAAARARVDAPASRTA